MVYSHVVQQNPKKPAENAKWNLSQRHSTHIRYEGMEYGEGVQDCRIKVIRWKKKLPLDCWAWYLWIVVHHGEIWPGRTSRLGNRRLTIATFQVAFPRGLATMLWEIHDGVAEIPCESSWDKAEVGQPASWSLLVVTWLDRIGHRLAERSRRLTSGKHPSHYKIDQLLNMHTIDTVDSVIAHTISVSQNAGLQPFLSPKTHTL
jgi:hypothetical protein